MKEIIPPTHCPSCDSELEEVNFQLFCRNTVCGAKNYKMVENFCKVMKYKGLGPETIIKANLTTIEEVLKLITDDSQLRVAVGDKITDKVVEIISQSRTSASLSQIIQALSIPLIGKVAADKIAKAAGTIGAFTTFTMPADAINWGLTEKILENLQEWWYHNGELCGLLPQVFSIKETKEVEQKEHKGVVCITGKLSNFKVKQEGYDYALSLGFKVVESYNKTVTHLINESGNETSTTLKAKQNNTIVLNNIFELEEV